MGLFFKRIFIITFTILFALSLSLLFSYERPELEFTYVKVKEGNTFWELFKDKWEIVSRINKIDEYHLLPGTLLKVPLDRELAEEYPFFPEFLEQRKEIPKLILVVIQEQFLAGYEFGELKFWYPVCSGMEKGLTPEWFLKMEAEKERQEENKDEELTVEIKKQIQPVNYPTPRGRFNVLYKKLNHKSNIYPKPDGGQPMLFAMIFSWKGYGLHAWGIPKHLKQWFEELAEDEIDLEGYSFSGMPGWPASHGCIRLFIEDAQKLFEWARVGTVVLIIDSFEKLE